MADKIGIARVNTTSTIVSQICGEVLRNTTFIDVYLFAGEHARARRTTNLSVEARWLRAQR